jgi:hypothetical protein
MLPSFAKGLLVFLCAGSPLWAGDSALLKPLAEVPAMEQGAVAAGRRVRVTEPEYAGTDVHHSLYLPADFDASKPHPLIVEFTGNFHPPSRSTGEVGGARLGFAATLGKDFVWLVLPFVATDGKHNEVTWWGDEAATVRYAKTCVRRVFEKYNIDRSRVVLCGFSRGAIALGYIGLHDDEIASLWSAFLSHDNFDGLREWKKTAWGTPLEKYRAGAAERLRRLRGRPFWVGQNPGTEKTEGLLRTLGVADAARFHFESVPMKTIFPTIPHGLIQSAHNDVWPLYPTESSERLRAWLRGGFTLPKAQEQEPAKTETPGAAGAQL